MLGIALIFDCAAELPLSHEEDSLTGETGEMAFPWQRARDLNSAVKKEIVPESLELESSQILFFSFFFMYIYIF